ncbi:hypothetical protein J3Q64DRAFT_1826215 [Phycomyces blakesleeanus]|uniref:Uncharacterized protein n=2 Tax=Phycomyces blakesleeanus TaxID=4837 RepID=A0A162ZEU8_PHYB8|nr:hypothetical protein PHYBLDRAFT_175348 [Phycomyces blakesleeanus NRRL 1555(-)]OAD66291.1 hypothetical protein PHYBLDRAFT_175348 [Phycomyces blakesleeanus NRRL 1555(-)]|eukprot:XP_018284331.1 hypothetical protein PHYBLDRAFT_175348 [Phycomyces blakesleeanus NRRL 1555(-)]
MENITAHVNKKMDRYLDNIKLVNMPSKGFELRILKMYSRWLKEYAYRQTILGSWKPMSEQDNSGETENQESKELQEISTSFYNGKRGDLKVHLRICLKHDGKLFDVCNIEISRNGDMERKTLTDTAKVMLEGKCILDQVVKIGILKGDQAKDVEVLNAQLCGLKGVLIGVRLEESERGYVAESRSSTLCIPTRIAHLPSFSKTMVPAVLIIKEQAEKNANIMLDALDKDNSQFGSQSPNRENGFLKPTWLGPKPSSPKVVPPLPKVFLA